MNRVVPPCRGHQPLHAVIADAAAARVAPARCHPARPCIRVASDLYSNLFATYNICSFHRCASDRALDVYTKVIRKYPAAVVLHAPKKRHMFMSYDGLFIQRKGGAKGISTALAQRR